MKTNPLNTTRKQGALQPRKEPYWWSFKRGGQVGLYVGTESKQWVARAKAPDHTYKQRTLGSYSDMTYPEAEAAAARHADQTASTTRPDYRISDAVSAYIADLRVRKNADAAHDAEQRLNSTVPPALGATRVCDLKSATLAGWRDGMVRQGDAETQRRSRDTANRVLSLLKAALNLAFKSGYAPSDAEWRRVTAFRAVAAARTLFLEPAQVQDLLASTEGPFHDLLQAAVQTGARYGELIAASAGDFDPAAGTLRLSGKTGTRTCYLSSDALALFRRLTKNSLPSAPLLLKADGTRWKKSHQHRLMQQAIRKAGLPDETVFYSLRHFHISRALLAGVNAQVIAENCGTSILMIERHYGKFTVSDRRRMMDSIAL